MLIITFKLLSFKSTSMKHLTFEIEKDGNQFHVWCPELPSCHSHGKTVKQALKYLKDAVNLYIETLMEEEITRKSLALENEAT